MDISLMCEKRILVQISRIRGKNARALVKVRLVRLAERLDSRQGTSKTGKISPARKRALL